MGAATMAGRRRAEALMADRCRITQAGGDPVWDEASGTYTEPAPVVVYEGKCRWRNAYPAPQRAEAGEATWAVDLVIVSIPVSGAGGIAKGQTVELTASAFDPASVGMTATVAADHVQTHSTACRLPCQVVSRDA